MTKSISVKNPGPHFTLKISANQRFGIYAQPTYTDLSVYYYLQDTFFQFLTILIAYFHFTFQAISEPVYSVAYANMCKVLSSQVSKTDIMDLYEPPLRQS